MTHTTPSTILSSITPVALDAKTDDDIARQIGSLRRMRAATRPGTVMSDLLAAYEAEQDRRAKASA